MKRYLIPLALLVFTALVIAPLAQTMRTANTTNDLVLLSPYTINTNTYVVTEGTIGDGTATWWTFVAGDVTGPDATHLQPLLYPTAGRWVKNTGGSGGTNIFNTIYATNIYGSYNYFSNVYVTNLFVTNIFNRGGAKPMIKLGDTNIYITNTFITINGTNLAVVNPTTPYVPYRNSATNFLDSAWYMVGGTNIGIDSQMIFGPGTTNVLYRSGPQLIYTNNGVLGNGVTVAIVNGNNKRAVYGIDQDEAAVVVSPAGEAIKLEPDNGSMVYFGSTLSFWPNTGNPTLGIDGSGSIWGDFFHRGTDYLYAFRDSTATNTVRLEKSMTGPQAVFNLTALTNNVNGPITGFSFRTNGVEVFNVTGTGGPSSGANWTAVGATDSSLAGTATIGGNLTGQSTTGTLFFPFVTAGQFNQYQQTLTHAGTTTLNFATTNAFSMAITGAVTIAFINLNTNLTCKLLLQGTSTNSAITWPAGIHGSYSSVVPANKWVLASMEAWGTTDATVVVATMEDL